MTAFKNLTGAFIIGGIFGVIGQALLSIYIGLLGPDSPLLLALLLVSMGLIGGILFIFGIYQKLEAIGGFGAMLPFSGLATGVSGTIVGAREAGASMGQAIKSGLMLVVFVADLGMVFSCIVGLIASFAG